MSELQYGWVGKILRVDLTSGKTSTIPTSTYAPKFIGGRAMAAKVYWDEVPPTAAAFDPENKIIFMTGVAGGTPAAGSSRTAIVTKSPVTIPECYMYSVTGGHWGAQLKFAGFDGLIVEGKAKEPVYLWIHDGEAELLSAKRLWGLKTGETDSEIRKAWGDKVRTMVIGPAGENLVRSAVIQNDLAHATGQGGFGAVMGSKNLKAIAVHGTGSVKIAKPKELLDIYDKYMKTGGTYGGPYVISSLGYGVFHYSKGKDIKPHDIKSYFSSDSYGPLYLAQEETAQGTMDSKFSGCFACPACCGLAYKSKDLPPGQNPPKDLSVPLTVGQQCFEYPFRDEYEDAEFKKWQGRPGILNYSHIQDLGHTMFVMGYHYFWFEELVKAGILTKENLGIPIDKPNSDEFLRGYTYGIAYKKGDMWTKMAEGQERFLQALAKENPVAKGVFERYISSPYYHAGHRSGRGAPSGRLAMLMEATRFRDQPNDSLGHFQGVSKQLDGFLPEKDVQAAIASVQKTYGPRLFGSEKAIDPSSFDGVVPMIAFFQNMDLERDSTMYCGWMGFPRFYSLYTPDHVGDPSIGSKLLSAVAGIDRTMEENVKAMEAAWNVERSIHVREGRRREHDYLTDAVFEANKGITRQEFDKALDEYYRARGWDVATGIPRRSTLEALDIKDVADDLAGKYGVQVPA
jgi:aldehyde:ferredoxin oxidoreductase